MNSLFHFPAALLFGYRLRDLLATAWTLSQPAEEVETQSHDRG